MSRKRSFIFLIAALLLSSSCPAQMVDSIRHFTREEPSFLVEFDTRHSFISARHGRIFGLNFGVEHNDRVSYGGGINWLTNTRDHQRELGFGDTSVAGNLSFWFLSPFFEYTFYKSPHWELSMPVRIGMGGASFTYYDPVKDKQMEQHQRVFNYEPMMIVQYKFWRYFGITTGLGYRIIFLDGPILPQGEGFDLEPYRFTSPTYAFGFNFFFGKMFRDIFPKKSEQVLDE